VTWFLPLLLHVTCPAVEQRQCSIKAGGLAAHRAQLYYRIVVASRLAIAGLPKVLPDRSDNQGVRIVGRHGKRFS